jgi:hypothetical protein
LAIMKDVRELVFGESSMHLLSHERLV